MSNITREIITLQLGHYSNFVGTHWWNIQESSFIYSPSEETGPKEVNHDVLFREGRNLMGDVTYTPRLVAFDLKGSLNTLRQEGKLYDVREDEDNLKWPNDVTLHQAVSAPKNEFLRDLEMEEAAMMPDSDRQTCDKEETDGEQDAESEMDSGQPQVFGTKLYDLDGSVDVWSDFLRLHLHPRSVHIIDKYQHNSSVEQFDVFGMGQEVFTESRSRREIEDRLHFFLEEADNFQGVHILADTHDAFSGVACSVVEDLADEYSNKGIFSFGISPPYLAESTPAQDSYRVINSALCYEKLASLSSAFLPLSIAQSLWRKMGRPVSFPHLQYKRDLSYHTAAILAASVDTMSLPYRLERDPSLLTHLTGALTSSGRKVLGLHTSLPFPLHETSNLVDTLMAHGERLPWQPLTPECQCAIRPTAQSVVVRGVAPGRLKSKATSGLAAPLLACNTVDEIMNLYLRDASQSTLNAICNVEQPCMVTAPFPHIFSPGVNRDGLLSTSNRPSNVGVDSVPMMTCLQATESVGKLLDNLVVQVTKLDIKKYHRYAETGLEEDEFRENIQNLQALAQCYETDTVDMV